VSPVKYELGSYIPEDDIGSYAGFGAYPNIHKNNKNVTMNT
jgi:hypothetical protein